MADGLAPLPPMAAWRHDGAGREGFEVAVVSSSGAGHVLEGTTTALDDGEAWWVRYRLEADDAWRTRRAEAWNRTAGGAGHVVIDADGEGRWWVDGAPVPGLDGCIDVDLESSALTNTLPVHRLGLHRNEVVHSPAAFVRAASLAVERLEQRYERLTRPDDPDGWAARYEAPRFGVTARLVFDRSGLVVDYPGVATRAG